MQGNEIILSVIMPCYNVEETLDRALESILMQECDYAYEIIIIDDASTDETVQIANKYVNNYSNISLIKNSENLGNAKTFFKGLSNSKGKYFCVLDGDDYYTVRDKFQRQLRFMERDLDEEYVATAHHYVIDTGNGNVFVSHQSSIEEFYYVDLLKMNTGGYYHTATYIYRNIFKDNPLGYYNEVIFRGDTPRTTFHLKYSNKKVKILNFVGSVYTFLNTGIWSSMSQCSQFEYQVKYLNALKETVQTDFEIEAIEHLKERNLKASLQAEDKLRKYPEISINECISKIRRIASLYAFSNKEIIFNGLYFSEYIDSLITTIGELYRWNNPQYKIVDTNEKNIGIIIGVLNPQGGGIFKEITELCEIYSEKSIYIFVTNMEEVKSDIIEEVNKIKNVKLIYPTKDCKDKLAFFHEKMFEVSPEKLYSYTSHNDVIGQVLIQRGKCKNISFFSFDHGYICGLSNANIDKIIAKRPMDYNMLRQKFSSKVIFIPTWNFEFIDKKTTYIPFEGHDNLITASGAARFYKLNGGKPYNYSTIILNLLKKTKGSHFHYGPIPEDKKTEIYKNMDEMGIDRNKFINIEWADDMVASILENKVDIFIEPFPVVSYKMSLALMSSGIPIISYNGCQRMTKMDFIYEGALKWNYEDELIRILDSIDSKDLQAHSDRTIKYFNETHNINILKEYIFEDKPFHYDNLESIKCVDNNIVDVRDMYSIFGGNSLINLNPNNKKEIKNKKEMDKNSINQKCLKTKKDVDELKASNSYKVGKVVTSPIKCTLGLCGVKRFKVKQDMAFYMDADEEINAILNSNFYRVGRACTWPVRMIKKPFIKKD